MRYLIKHRFRFFVAISVCILLACDIANAFTTGSFINEAIAIMLAMFVPVGLYLNMPTSKENCEHTGASKFEKQYKKGKITGENFFDDCE